jgi:hypothetical protein
MKNYYLDLIKSIQRKGVLRYTGLVADTDDPPASPKTQFAIANVDSLYRNFARPNIEFGYLLDREEPHLGYELYTHFCEEAHDRLDTGDFFLPHPRCAYIFHYNKPDKDMQLEILCVLLDETEGEIVGRTFRQIVLRSGVVSPWVLDPFLLRLNGTHGIEFIFDTSVTAASQEAIDIHLDHLMPIAGDVLVATAIMTSPAHLVRTEAKRSVSLDAYNCKRKLGSSRLEPPTIVHLNREVLAVEANALARASEDRKLTTPHERRAHVRIIGRGTDREREVRVKAASIKGGKLMQMYRVVQEDSALENKLHINGQRD